MRVLVLGSGGREHAIAWKLSQSPRVSKVFVAPGNDGMRPYAQLVPLHTHHEIIDFVEAQQIDLTLVGQEVYLVHGLVDQMTALGHRVLGPTAAAAALEGSKAFAKAFMHKYGIPTAAYGTFREMEPAFAFLQTLQPPYVIKASGLAAGKGVVIVESLPEAEQVIATMLNGDAFGEAGQTIVIEEFMPGEEASYFVLTDGTDFVSLASAQDHKRIGEGDTGPNTGGMGAYSPAPVLTPELEAQVIETIVKPTIAGMRQEGHPYQGVLYIGLMIDSGQARVVEYNCRFGDPECQSLMMRLKSDFLPLALAVVEGKLAQQSLEWHEASAVCIVLASQGYPGSYEKGKAIRGLTSPEAPPLASPEVMVFHAGTVWDGRTYRTHGGRVLGVTALGSDLSTAIQHAYAAVAQIQWEGMTYRRDIGQKGLTR